MARARNNQIDWVIAKELYLKGLTHKEIAEKVGASILTVQKKAQRDSWTDARKAVTQSSPKVTHQDTVNEWLQGVTTLLERITADANAIGRAKTRRDLKDDADTLRSLIAAGRDHFGLDKEGQQVTVGLSIAGSRLQLAVHCQPNSQSVAIQAPLSEGESNEQAIDVQTTEGEAKETPEAGAPADQAPGVPLSCP